MQAHVICMNDSVEHVHFGTEEQAQAKLEELRDAYFERTRWNWEERRTPSGEVYQTREVDYKQRCYWHIHTVQATLPPFPAGVDDLYWVACQLTERAEDLGQILTIEREPLHPLASGNHRPRVELRPRRKGPRP